MGDAPGRRATVTPAHTPECGAGLSEGAPPLALLAPSPGREGASIAQQNGLLLTPGPVA